MPKVRVKRVQNALVVIARCASGAVGWNVADDAEHVPHFKVERVHHVAGAASFEDMRRVNGVLRPSFQDACVQRGLLQDDREWRSCLEEARQIVFVPHCLCVCGTVWEVS